MKIRTALTIALAMSGKYNTGETLVAKGFDHLGNPIEETFPAIDSEKLSAEVDALVASNQ